MPQITTITSEALQATVRRLLPSQRGFGQDLEAQNVIVPIVDLTPTAEGSQLPESLQTAFSFGGQTTFTANNDNTVTVVNSPGFYRVYASSSVQGSSTTNKSTQFKLSKGGSDKVLSEHIHLLGGLDGEITVKLYDFVVFIDSGDALQGFANTDCFLTGTSAQIADRYGNLNNPSGFTFE